MSTYRYHCVGFTPQQQEAISAIFDLAEATLTSTWSEVSVADSDVVLVNLDDADGEQQFQALRRERPAYSLIAVAEDPAKSEGREWFLAKKPTAPPSLKELAALLNQVADRLAAEIVTATVEPVAPEPRQDQPINPLEQQSQDLSRPLTADNYFFGLLLKAKQDKSSRVFKLDALAELYLSPTENSYYFAGSVSELAQYCTSSPRRLSETLVTKAKLNKAVKNSNLSAQALDNLLAYAILKAGAGRLLAGHDANRAVKLKRLPEANKIPVLADYRGIAEHLQRQPASLSQLAQSMSLPIAQVFDFYNAYWLLGYLETTASESKPGAFTDYLKSWFGK